MENAERAQEIFEKLEAGTWWPFDQIPTELISLVDKLYKKKKADEMEEALI